MQRPRIGIPLCLDDRGRWRDGHDYHYIDGGYSAAVASAGGLAHYLPIQTDAAEALVDHIDGLLLPGGDDLEPESDEADPDVIAALDLAPAAQVRFDRALAEAALARGIPVLGICYGMQLLARIRGGQIEAHLPTSRPGAPPHRLEDPAARHALRIAPDSQLAALVRTGATEVNSLHHQAVRALGESHRAVAWSDDGLIEAFEPSDPEAPFEFGVQWHPEKMNDPVSEKLFQGFVAAADRPNGSPRAN